MPAPINVFNTISFGIKTILKNLGTASGIHILIIKYLLSIQMKKEVNLQHTQRILGKILEMDLFEFDILIICFPIAHLEQKRSCKVFLTRAPT